MSIFWHFRHGCYLSNVLCTCFTWTSIPDKPEYGFSSMRPPHTMCHVSWMRIGYLHDPYGLTCFSIRLWYSSFNSEWHWSIYVSIQTVIIDCTATRIIQLGLEINPIIWKVKLICFVLVEEENNHVSLGISNGFNFTINSALEIHVKVTIVITSELHIIHWRHASRIIRCISENIELDI